MQYVEAPAPGQQRAGSLLAAANTPPQALVRVDQSGYHAPACTGWRVYDPCSTTTVQVDQNSTGMGTVPQGMPFPIEALDTCSTLGDVNDHAARARARLAAVESAAIARELWTGELADVLQTTNALWDVNLRLAGQARSEVQSIGVVGATAGTFTLSFEGQTTTAIAFNAAAAAVQAALQALPSIGAGGATVTGGPANTTLFTVTFAGARANDQVGQITVNTAGLTGGVVTQTTTTQGSNGGSSPATVLNGGTAVASAEGVALLEDALAGALAGAPGAIHMTRRALTRIAASSGGGLFRREGDLILTLTDTRVIADAGYPGTQPSGAAAAAGEAWLYGTARPTVWRSDVDVTPADDAEALNRDLNTRTWRASRFALTLIPCGVYAVRVTL